MTENDETCLKTLCELRKQAEASHALLVARWETATEAKHEAYEVMEEAKEAYKKIKLSSDILMREVNESRLCYYAFIEAEKIALSATQPETCEPNG